MVCSRAAIRADRLVRTTGLGRRSGARMPDGFLLAGGPTGSSGGACQTIIPRTGPPRQRPSRPPRARRDPQMAQLDPGRGRARGLPAAVRYRRHAGEGPPPGRARHRAAARADDLRSRADGAEVAPAARHRRRPPLAVLGDPDLLPGLAGRRVPADPPRRRPAARPSGRAADRRRASGVRLDRHGEGDRADLGGELGDRRRRRARLLAGARPRRALDRPRHARGAGVQRPVRGLAARCRARLRPAHPRPLSPVAADGRAAQVLRRLCRFQPASEDAARQSAADHARAWPAAADPVHHHGQPEHRGRRGGVLRGGLGADADPARSGDARWLGHGRAGGDRGVRADRDRRGGGVRDQRDLPLSRRGRDPAGVRRPGRAARAPALVGERAAGAATPRPARAAGAPAGDVSWRLPVLLARRQAVHRCRPGGRSVPCHDHRPGRGGRRAVPADRLHGRRGHRSPC